MSPSHRRCRADACRIDHTGCYHCWSSRAFAARYIAAVTLSLYPLMRGSAHCRENITANKRGFFKHKPALPLYREDAEIALERLVMHPYLGRNRNHSMALPSSCAAGHILGACTVLLKDEKTSILFSALIWARNKAAAATGSHQKRRIIW